ncbi:MBL fold metallo-hydrolase [candidate division KSB1 bacterium]|nr:MBL fold metallo-hydrolase [candidate division KSB1 bacterium]
MKQDVRFVFYTGLVFLLAVFSCKENQSRVEKIPVYEGQSWFSSKLIADKVWCINDHGSDNIYLVEGEKQALLIDTGIGVADLASYVKTITKLPVIVVNTHGHPDHAGGNFQFSKVYAHPLDFELIKIFTSKEYHDNSVQRAINEYPNFESSFIKEISTSEEPVISPVQAGFVFDLGNRKLEVVEVPGHTKGSIALLDTENKLLFTGDNNNTLVWLFLDGCLPIESYLQTLEKLNQRSGEFEKILPEHGDVLDKLFINEQIICAKNIISGECQGEKYESFAGSALLCRYKRAGIAYNPDNIHIK